jgi:predicted phosphodiesterase
LEHYLKEGFTYIELGDAEELWENDAFEQIYITHTSIYDLLRRFHDPDPAKTRYLKVWGNHDEDWRDSTTPLRTLFPDIQVHEAILLGPILLLHGHQVDPICSGPRARISRLLVRKFWSVLQQIGFIDPTRAAENPGSSNKIDKILYRFARGKMRENRKLSRLIPDNNRENGSIVIAGHTHRPVFANLSLTERRFLETGIGTPGVLRKDKAEPVYYNTGSCVHPRCITGIEITAAPSKDNEPVRPHFTLVKWGYIAGDEICAADGCRSFPIAITRTVLEDG